MTQSGSIDALVSAHKRSVSSKVADNTQGGGLRASVDPGNNWNLRPRGPSYCAGPFFVLSPGWRLPTWVGRPAISARCSAV